MSTKNILQNGEMDGIFVPFRDDPDKLLPQFWAPWWQPNSGRSVEPAWKNQDPVYESFILDARPVAHVMTPYATHTGGMYQQVPAVEGERYDLSVDAQAWSSEAERQGEIQEPSDVNLQVGIDPTGGLDPFSPIVQWCKPAQPIGGWERLRIGALAQASVMTIFLKSAPSLPKRQTSVFWRNAELTPVGRYKRATNIVGPGDTFITLEPERPMPDERVVATISSLRPQKQIDLHVHNQAGDLLVTEFLGSRQIDDRTLWQYAFVIEAEGLFDLRFVGDGGARLMSQRLMRVAREVQIVPSGAARLAYKRVYILLPPTADEEWFTAAARGGFHGRYTIGFSVDDGGVGDVGERVVIAVNPHHWPETLTAAWYQHHYPGTRFIPVVAKAPEDLEGWLGEWVDM